jgi:hypothetical protein
MTTEFRCNMCQEKVMKYDEHRYVFLDSEKDPFAKRDLCPECAILVKEFIDNGGKMLEEAEAPLLPQDITPNLPEIVIKKAKRRRDKNGRFSKW